MPNTCCVTGCKTGYRGHGQAPGVALFRFPADPLQYAKWMEAIPRSKEGWIPSKTTRVCSIHFDLSDFKLDRTDSNKRRSKNLGDIVRLRLQPYAVPSVFPDPPIKVKKTKPRKRRSKKSEYNDDDDEEEYDLPPLSPLKFRLEEDSREFGEECNSLEMLKTEIQDCLVPAPYDVIRHESDIMFVEFCFNSNNIPEVWRSLVIYDDLTFSMSVNGEAVAVEEVNELTDVPYVRSMLSVCNILTFLKNIPKIKDEVALDL